MINNSPSFRSRLQVRRRGRPVAGGAFQFVIINEHIFGCGAAPLKSNWRELTGGTGTFEVSGVDVETLTWRD